METIPEYHFREPDYRKLTAMMFFKNIMIVSEAMALEGKPREQIEAFAAEMAKVYTYLQDVTKLAAEQEKRIEGLETTVARLQARLAKKGMSDDERRTDHD